MDNCFLGGIVKEWIMDDKYPFVRDIESIDMFFLGKESANASGKVKKAVMSSEKNKDLFSKDFLIPKPNTGRLTMVYRKITEDLKLEILFVDLNSFYVCFQNSSFYFLIFQHGKVTRWVFSIFLCRILFSYVKTIILFIEVLSKQVNLFSRIFIVSQFGLGRIPSIATHIHFLFFPLKEKGDIRANVKKVKKTPM